LCVHLTSPIHVTCPPPTSLSSPLPPHPNNIKGQHDHGNEGKLTLSLNRDVMTPKLYEKILHHSNDKSSYRFKKYALLSICRQNWTAPK